MKIHKCDICGSIDDIVVREGLVAYEALRPVYSLDWPHILQAKINKPGFAEKSWSYNKPLKDLISNQSLLDGTIRVESVFSVKFQNGKDALLDLCSPCYIYLKTMSMEY